MADSAALMLEEVSGEIYDQEEKRGLPQKLMEWVGKVLQSDNTCSGKSWEEIKAYLQDGAVLCRLLNRLREALDMMPILPEPNPDKDEDVAKENIDLFLEGAHEYGIRKTACFLASDLTQGTKGTMLDVLFCLTALGFNANANDYEVRYEAPVHAPPPTE